MLWGLGTEEKRKGKKKHDYLENTIYTQTKGSGTTLN